MATTRICSSALLWLGFSFMVFFGCERETGSLSPATYPADPGVFLDGFGPGVAFQAFGGSKLDAVGIDGTVKYAGARSIKVTVPNSGDPFGGYAGGAFVTGIGRDLTGYNALTFWAKASRASTLDLAGFGNNNTSSSPHVAQIGGLRLYTIWTKYVIPIPLASRLTAEQGLFHFAEAPDSAGGYEIWFDEIQFENLATVAHPRPFMAARTTVATVGDSFDVGGTAVLFNVAGVEQRVEASTNYFTFSSSNQSVATVTPSGKVRVVGLGIAEISASLGTATTTNKVRVNSIAGPSGPAPTPTQAAGNVISLFSNAYSNVPVTTWSTSWDLADLTDVRIGNDDAKRYTNLVYAAIEFTTPTIDASSMTNFRIDIWTPDTLRSNPAFKIKLVDFGADGVFGGGNDSESELSFSTASNPPISRGNWVSLDIPLARFSGLQSRAHLAQLILSGASGGVQTVWIDNVYFYTNLVQPIVPAPTPTYPAADVISLYSNPYTNVPVDTWSASWDQADVSDVLIAGNDTKKYTNLIFAGIEFTTQPINATAMTRFRMDIWTPDPTALPAIFKIKLVDFGANGVFGGGDDVEHELTFNRNSSPALISENWVTFDIPLANFTGLVTRGHIAQLILSGDLRTVWVDNVLFHR